MKNTGQSGPQPKLEGAAVWFTGPRQASLVPETVRPPERGEVTVRSMFSLISPGTEMVFYFGQVPEGFEAGLPGAVTKSRFPVKFGYSCVGRVEQTANGTEHLAGKLVFVRHPHQSLFTSPVEVNGRLVVRALPQTVSPELATFCNLADVAVNALLDVPVRIGDVVVVFGCGIVGLCIAQLATRTGGCVIAVDPLAHRRELAQELGVNVAVDPENVGIVVQERTNGRGADVVFEASGAGSALQQALEITGVSGTIAVVSFYGDRKVELRLTPEFHTRAHNVVSTMVGRLNPSLSPRWDTQRRGEVALGLLDDLHVHRMITHRIRFADASHAFEIAADRNSGGLGVILVYPGDEAKGAS
jgi:2-desacetyl-2-hydroxyethyl bacteriochlorophyllide A dehydrogenase